LITSCIDHRTGAIERDYLEDRLKKEGVLSKHIKDVVELLETFHIVIPMEYNKLLVPALLEDDPLNTMTLTLGTFPRPCTLKLKPPQPVHLPTPISALHQYRS